MDIVDSFGDKKYYDDDYDDIAIPSNAIISAEADAPAVPQSRTFAAAAFLGWDIAFFSSLLSFSSSSNFWSLNDKRLSSRLSHRYDTDDR